MDLSIDRRASRRFQIVLPVLFRWSDSVERYAVGDCTNIGQGGLFILASKCAALGAAIEIEFSLPAFDMVPYPIKLRCTGRVSRVETCYQLSGFAVSGQFANESLDSPFAKSATAERFV